MEYLCTSAHMPFHGQFPFECPHCAAHFESQQDCNAEEELTGKPAKEYERSHGDCKHKEVPLFDIDTEDIVQCTLHMLLAGVRHQWTHSIAWYVKDKAQATRIMQLLHEKCNVMMDVVTVSKGKAGKAVKLKQVDGRKTRAVAACFKLFLKFLKEVHDV